MLPPLFHGHTMMVNHSISSVLGPISSKALINPHTLRHRPRTCCCLDHLSCIPGLGVERSAAHGHIQKCSFCCSFCSMANLKNQLCLIQVLILEKKSCSHFWSFHSKTPRLYQRPVFQTREGAAEVTAPRTHWGLSAMQSNRFQNLMLVGET